MQVSDIMNVILDSLPRQHTFIGPIYVLPWLSNAANLGDPLLVLVGVCKLDMGSTTAQSQDRCQVTFPG